MTFEIELSNPLLPTNSRPVGARVNTIVLHATASTNLDNTLEYMKRKKVDRVSYHYLIGKNGRIIKCAPITKRAWHAGKSVGPQGEDVNDYSIGIAFVNANDGQDPYTLYQIEAAKWLIPQLKANMYEYKWITTHAIIAPKRKTDPKNFPLEEFAKSVGLKVWSNES
jgi:N-acetyl-anhydromuramyl-L-alanine amidase AmpD